jgi:hypothetical protein
MQQRHRVSALYAALADTDSLFHRQFLLILTCQGKISECAEDVHSFHDWFWRHNWLCSRNERYVERKDEANRELGT